MKVRGSHITALIASIATLCIAPAAHAQVSAWAQVGGGAMAWQEGPDGELGAAPIMNIDVGMGSNPDNPFILGAYFKLLPVLTEGVDLALMARFANGGFQTDYIGFAFDAGLYQRTWGLESTGFLGQAILGLPLGFQLAGFGMAGTEETFGFGGTLGIDFVQLTVDRQHLTEWWHNPRPSDQRFRSDVGGTITRF